MNVFVKTECEFKTSSDAIEYGASLLREAGLVTDDYGEQLIKREAIYPTGIESITNFSICHTETEYSRADGICVLIMKDSVEFHNMVEKEKTLPIKVLFLLASDTANGHMLLLQKIINIMSDEKTTEVFYRDSETMEHFFMEKLNMEDSKNE